ncbi:MAG: membrane protein insertion efficiency factor YidD [Candidatus Latescibacteria bacterium]|nr:membrane protein insertion efficiency factor YidD [Candidatus Latescibacterota bacterium]
MLSAVDRLLAGLTIILLRFYRLCVSPFLQVVFGPGGGCRFHPTCSRYARDCLRQHPFPFALYLSVSRILKCHPFHPGGIDPAPPKRL